MNGYLGRGQWVKGTADAGDNDQMRFVFDVMDLSNHTLSTMATDVQSNIASELSRFNPPTLSQSVHREECTQCFDNQVCFSSIPLRHDSQIPQDGPLGIDICLSCFNGGCLSPERHHAHTHAKNTGHQFTLNIKRLPRPRPKRVRHRATLSTLPLPARSLTTSATGRRRRAPCEDEEARNRGRA